MYFRSLTSHDFRAFLVFISYFIESFEYPEYSQEPHDRCTRHGSGEDVVSLSMEQVIDTKLSFNVLRM